MDWVDDVVDDYFDTLPDCTCGEGDSAIDHADDCEWNVWITALISPPKPTVH